MALSPKLLGAGEQVVIHTRTHAKALVPPAAALIALGGLVGAGLAAVPVEWGVGGAIGVVTLGLAAAGWLAVRPFLRWLTTTYTVTTRRLITRSGVLRRHGKDLPLMRINDVSSEFSLLDRVFGCGTLSVRTAAEGGPLQLVDVPDVRQVHLVLSELLVSTDRQRSVDPPSPGARR